MKIGILSRNPSLYSTNRLVQAGRLRGHQMAVIDTVNVAVEVGLGPIPDGIKIVKSDARALGSWERQRMVSHLPAVDAIIPRIGASITQLGLGVVRQFEMRGVLTTAVSTAIAQSRDKLHSLQLMAQAGLPVPKTAVVAHPDAIYTAIQAVNGPPVIFKLSEGTQGRGVILIPNFATAAAVMKKLRQLDKQILVQEFIQESAGRDLRVIVVGNRCVAAMERRAESGNFRANLHQGGTAVPVSLNSEIEQLAIQALKTHKLGVAGIDILQSSRGPLLLEVNSSPGLEGIEQVTEKDVATPIIRYLEKQFRRK